MEGWQGGMFPFLSGYSVLTHRVSYIIVSRIGVRVATDTTVLYHSTPIWMGGRVAGFYCFLVIVF